MRKFLFLVIMMIITSCTTTQITTSDKSHISVYDIYGRKVIQISSDSCLDTDKLNGGVYFMLIIENEKNPYWDKIVKIK